MLLEANFEVNNIVLYTHSLLWWQSSENYTQQKPPSRSPRLTLSIQFLLLESQTSSWDGGSFLVGPVAAIETGGGAAAAAAAAATTTTTTTAGGGP